ncbi:MAG TPA: S24 family peptidase, partial [Rhizobium sp.]|nr:S24 family peptidase [Rhizobium sp.]
PRIRARYCCCLSSIYSITLCHMRNRDREHLAKLRDYYAAHRVLPSFSTIAQLVGLKTTSAVSVMVGRMKTAGYLQEAPGRRLQPGKRFFERDVADTVRAGYPQAANEIPIEGMNIDAYLVENPSRTVLLGVKGDSMTDAGLLPGDTIIVKKGAPAKPGDIVVAIVDDDYTVKYLARDQRGFYLKPGNKAYEPIRAQDHLEVFGLVVGTFRKYG